jgi:hypothetical protein
MLFILSNIAYGGLEVLSSSPVRFISSGDSDFDVAFLINAVENGGSERIYFSDLPTSDGYLMKNTNGYISASPSDVHASYPYTARPFSQGEIYFMEKANEGKNKWHLSYNDAQKWCEELKPNEAYAQAAKEGDLYTGWYWCFFPRLEGFFGDIQTPDYRWAETFSIYNSITGETQRVVLTHNERAGSSEYRSREVESSNRKILIRYVLSGVETTLPNVNSEYSVFFKDGGLRVTEYIRQADYTGYRSKAAVHDTFSRAWLGNDYNDLVNGRCGAFNICRGNDPNLMSDNIRFTINGFIRSTSINELNWRTTYDYQSSTSGRINLERTDGNLPRTPQFTIKLDAEWVGVYQPVTEPKIISFEAEKGEYVEGDFTARFESVVKNNGDVDGTIQYKLTCGNDVSISATQPQSFRKGETKTLRHSAFANTAGETIIEQCCLEVSDRSNPLVKDGPVCATIKFIERNQCPDGMEAGDSSCSASDEILQCKQTSDGILILQATGVVCDYACSEDGGRAVCEAKPGCQDLYARGKTCGDGICESFESTGKDCECLEDCSQCGDGYCSAIEQDVCPQDCGTPPHCSDGIRNFDETGIDCGGSDCKDCPNPDVWIWVAVGVAFLGVGGAIFLRLRKEGYFK